MQKKTFTVLENNPEVFNQLAYQLGLSKELAFYDVLSLHDPDLLAFIPRPVYALLAIIPLSKSWDEARQAEDATTENYDRKGPEEPVIWFKQVIRHGCGSIGLLHCAMNGLARNKILPGTDLEKLMHLATPLGRTDRANLLEEYEPLFSAHQAAGQKGDTIAPDAESSDRLGQHFVAFVKGNDNHLWELEGSRNGPLDRGRLDESEDALSSKAIELGIGKLIEIERAQGDDLRFSCIALAPSMEKAAKIA